MSSPCCNCKDYMPEYECIDLRNCIRPAQWDAWTALPDDAARSKYAPDDMPEQLITHGNRFAIEQTRERIIERKMCEWPHGCKNFAKNHRTPQKYALCNKHQNCVIKRMQRGVPESEWYAPSKKGENFKQRRRKPKPRGKVKNGFISKYIAHMLMEGDY